MRSDRYADEQVNKTIADAERLAYTMDDPQQSEQRIGRVARATMALEKEEIEQTKVTQAADMTESVDRLHDASESRNTEAVAEKTQDAADEKPKKRFGRKAEKKSPEEPAELDLTKMKKKELLEIMLAQGKEIDRLNARVSELEAQLADREFEFSRIGSIAEASLAVTDIFKEAEEAAKIYLENIRRRCEKKF